LSDRYCYLLLAWNWFTCTCKPVPYRQG